MKFSKSAVWRALSNTFRLGTGSSGVSWSCEASIIGTISRHKPSTAFFNRLEGITTRKYVIEQK